MKPKAPDMGVVELTQAGGRFDAPHVDTLETGHRQLKVAFEMQLDGGIAIPDQVEWIIRYQGESRNSGNEIPQVGLINFRNPHLLGHFMPVVVWMVDSFRESDWIVWDGFIGNLTE